MPSSDAECLGQEELTRAIIGAFYYVYNRLGSGFLESVYANALERVLTRRGMRVAREILVPIHFDGEIIAYQRLDMLVNDAVIVELKASEVLQRNALPQLYNYLSATRIEV